MDTDIDALKPFLRRSTSWQCTTYEGQAPVAIYFVDGVTEVEDAPVIVYVMNHGGERIGQESDVTILQDYVDQGYVVFVVDFQVDPRAVSPDFDADLHGIYQSVYGRGDVALLDGLGVTPREFKCFFLPSGYRLAPDIVYWELDKHAVYGTLDYVMLSYNEVVPGKVPGKAPISSPEEMTDADGNPFDYTIKMDVIYPSQASRKVPLMYYLATQPNRLPSGSVTEFRPHLIGFAMRGYATALIGHCHNPVCQHYWHLERFELSHWNGLACYTAAIRYLRAHAADYGIDSRYFGGAGHSKGQYSVTRLLDPNNAAGSEHSRFPGYPEGTPKPQPWPGHPSHISAGYQSMGMGLFRPQYITKDYAPTLVACGQDESLTVSLVGHNNFVKRLEELDVNHLAIRMKGLGHALPYGFDEDLGVDRYRQMHDFFDRYLKVEWELRPVVLLISPCDGKVDVSPWEPVCVHFAPVVEPDSASAGMTFVRVRDGSEVEGRWRASHGGTRFTYEMARELEENERYRITVTTQVRDENGRHLEADLSSEFETGTVARWRR